ncbi:MULTISPECIES: extracellular catalytic domain type 1 short-chain-length polyhydroxyalkanoate depolymerase [Bradyrhizobium]|uniref:Esterase, PHB depolymerase family n=2 Tax=Bradyrhizobium TaxID=374 RepID=A0ABY0PRW2_9BRAD|nr:MULTISPECIES: PHB depolymerase family esterase [Bradyrhizobium]SDI85732.1 esterase, PHB depolymerase family [Bradyrhizobium ottawaense]SED14221.1 esterase, PHB depolymerase family [Bradyrhizobium lablabi]SHL19550.1 esterase, PHB depolymerase family [Bradyrhizobium lablabi]
MSLAQNVEFMRQFSKLSGFNGLGAYGRSASAVPSPLVEIGQFGTNPGALRMFSFVPEHLQRAPALVVVLHGCGQTAAGYDLGAGWSTLAKRYGFALLMPEQQASNNGNTCFNWFDPGDTTRGRGEAASIRQMIARMVVEHKIDSRRIYVTGLSAGGAMASAMLATYPDVFAGGAVIAGLPYGIASNVREALNGMMQSASRPARELGDLVRKASKHKGPWPKLSVWHGSADRTVNPANANEIVKQWLDVHGLPSAPMSTADVDGYPRDVWWNEEGETVVESYTITDMAHGTPLGLAGGSDESYGAAGAFMIEAGISSSYHIANFFGLTERVSQPNEVVKPDTKSVARPAPKPAAPVVPSAATASLQSPELAATLWPRTTLIRHAKPPRTPKRNNIDVGAVITRALTAAGLMK